ncbi:efflux RND transporter periplasmic adaptor subunit [Pirellulaceae bacterium SH449]
MSSTNLSCRYVISNMKLRLIIGLTVVLSVSFSGCREQAEVAEPVRPVRAIQVNALDLMNDRWLPGRAIAAQEINLGFRVSGPIVDLAVLVGDPVKKGQIIAQIDPRDFQVTLRNAQANLDAARARLQAMRAGARPEELEQLKAMVEQAEVRLQTATSEFVRAEGLIQSQTISQSEYDQFFEAKIRADTDLRRAREQLQIGMVGARAEDIAAQEAEIRALEAATNSIENQLADTTLRAPFDGVVVSRYVENFEQVRANQAVVRVLDSSVIDMVINVPEGSISVVPYITDITCRFDAYPELRLPAEVRELGTEASRTTRTFPVRLRMQQPEAVRILPGMAGGATGQIVLPKERSNGPEIPESAVFERDGSTFVWVINTTDGRTGKAEARQVDIGSLSSRGLRIVQGLDSGQWIATAGTTDLQEGRLVRILDQTTQGMSP